MKLEETAMGYCKTNNDKKYKGIYRQYLASLTALIAMLIDGMFIGWLTPCLPFLMSSESPIPMKNDEISWMMTQMYVGQFISPIPIGYLMDWIGRKATMLNLAIFPICGWLLLAFATNTLMIDAAMFLAGLWSGTAYTVMFTYLGEITEPSVRGRITTLIYVVPKIGVVIEIVLGIYLPFYILPVISFTVPVLFLIAYPWMPESPYFYILRKDRDAACKSLRWLRGDLTEEEVREELNVLQDSVDRQMKENGSFIDLIRVKNCRRAFLTVLTLAVLQRLSGISTIIAYISISLPKTSIRYISPSLCVMIIDLVRLLSGLVSSFLVDYIGRRKLLVTTAFFCGLMMYSAGMWYYFNLKTDIDVTRFDYIPFVCFVIHGLSFSLGLGPVCSSIFSEYLPINIKAKSSALTSTTLALVSFIINRMYLSTSDMLGIYINYWIYGTSCFVIGIFSLCILIETKGKSLQQIQDELNSNNTPQAKTNKHQYS